MAKHLVVARLFDVEDFTFEREDRLELAIATLLGRAAGRFTLDEVELAQLRFALRAVGELARKATAVERALATS